MTAQLPSFIFYLGCIGVLLIIAGLLEAYGERFDKRKRKDAIRRARRAQAWAEVERLKKDPRPW